VKRVELLSDIQQAFSAPTRKQQEAYARLLTVSGVTCFIVGALLLKGE
jgi:hypothetical protein